MKVSIAVHSIHQGAFAAVARTVASGLRGHGAEVEIVYLAGPPPSPELVPEGVSLVPLRRRARYCSLMLARHLRRSRPDVLISLSWLLNTSAVLAAALSGTRIPVVLNEGSTLSYKARVEHRHEWSYRFADRIARLTYGRAAAVTGASAAIVRDLVDVVGIDPAGTRMRVVHNAVDPAIVVSRDEEIDMGDGPVFVNVARHARQKNLGLLLRAFSVFRDRAGHGTLWLIGAGPVHESLQALALELGIADHVRFPGHVSHPYPYVRRASAFVLSSEEEGFGLVLVEAMTLGTPVISTDCPGGPREVLQDGHSGVLVPPADVGALADSMERVVTDPDLRSHLVETGRRRAEDFHPLIVGEQWLALLDECVAGSPRRHVGRP